MPSYTWTMNNHRGTQDGKAWVDSGNYKWAHADGNVSLVVGEYIVCRMPLEIPKGAVVTAAEFSTEYGVKNGDTLPQTASFNVFMERYSPEYPTTNDSIIGPAGHFPPLPRQRASVATTASINYTTNTPGADYFTVDVAAIVQSIVDHPEYEPGQSVSVIMYCTAESGDLHLQMANNEFAARRPQLVVTFDYDPDVDDRRWNINNAPNETFEMDLEMVNMGTAFGFFVGGQSAELSTTQKRTGAKSLKVISGATDGDKAFGLQYVFEMQAGFRYQFSGWVWVPAHLPRGVQASIIFNGHYGNFVDARDQWVPFSTYPMLASTYGAVFGSILMAGPTDASYYFYVDDLCVTVSPETGPQMPFTGNTANTNLKSHYWPPGSSDQKGKSVRYTRARSQVHTGGSLKPREAYVLRSDGLWVRADPERQSPSWDDFDTNGMTWDQLRATGKTWDQMEADAAI